MRAAIYDPSNPRIVPVYHVMIWLSPDGENFAVTAVKYLEMRSENVAPPESAVLAVLTQLAKWAQTWNAPPVPINGDLPIPSARTVLLGVEIPARYRDAVARYLEEHP